MTLPIAPSNDNASVASPSVGDRLVYAIGDVHGRLDLLKALVADILQDAVCSQAAMRPLLILLGDYIDRGDESAGVVAFLCALKAHPALEVRALKGNHEQALLTFLADPSLGPKWTAYGGDATLASYGVAAPGPAADAEAWQAASAGLGAVLPPDHLDFLQSLELMIEVGDYLFVHAGIRPNVPLDAQTEHDVMWIREDFLEKTTRCGKVVVHGHTPAATVEIKPHRIGIDTGAFATGVLTAIRLDAADRTIFQARIAASKEGSTPLPEEGGARRAALGG